MTQQLECELTCRDIVHHGSSKPWKHKGGYERDTHESKIQGDELFSGLRVKIQGPNIILHTLRVACLQSPGQFNERLQKATEYIRRTAI